MKPGVGFLKTRWTDLDAVNATTTAGDSEKQHGRSRPSRTPASGKPLLGLSQRTTILAFDPSPVIHGVLFHSQRLGGLICVLTPSSFLRRAKGLAIGYEYASWREAIGIPEHLGSILGTWTDTGKQEEFYGN